MPYVFGCLVLANVALFGYFMMTPKQESQALKQAQAQLQAPVEFSNTTSQLPPEIGKK